MPTVYVEDCPVEFPHQPYPCQLTFLKSVLQALRQSSHALLESPTGTGKTLGLLCGSLAWRVEEMARRQREVQINPCEGGAEKPPLIIYASRTHSQLSQCIAELRRTSYRPRIAIIGGREQMCLKSGVRELGSAALGAVCQRLVKRKACEFHQRVGQVKLTDPTKEPELWDIEMLVEYGSKHLACPYYLSRELLKEADLIFMPYNYLLDGGTRAALTAEIDLKGAVVIFDEAHNVEGSCYDAVNCELESDDLIQAVKELEGCKKLLQDNITYGLDVKASAEAVDPAIRFLQTLLIKLNDPQLASTLAERGFHSQPGDAIFALLEGSGFVAAAHEALLKEYDELGKVMVEDQFTRRSSKRIAWLEVVSALKTIYAVDREKSDEVMPVDASAHEVATRNTERMTQVMLAARKNYRLVITASTMANGKRSLGYWCFNPGVVMKELVERGVRSIVLASGTLSPMRSFIQELQLDFKFILENDHVIGDDQVYASVIPFGPTHLPLNSSFSSRSSSSYQQELGLTVLRVSKCIPEGLLVFFPSYQVMEGCIKYWQQCRHEGDTIYGQISKVKAPLIEPKTKQELPAMMAHYTKLIGEGRGAVMFAVCRGKVSEGLDFADGLARGVIVTGIPYAPFKDPKIILKKQYLQDLPNSTLTGQEWYSQQATRAVNQALGRVIRHRADYGAVLLCDERFGQVGVMGQLSKWLRGRVKTFGLGKQFSDFEGELKTFFANRPSVRTSMVAGTANYSSSIANTKTTINSEDSIKAFKVDVESSFSSAPSSIVIPKGEGSVKKFDWFNSTAPEESKLTSATTSTAQIKTTKHSSEAQAQAQDYLKKVQSSLSAPSFSSFKSSLTDFKKGLLGVEALLKKICELFEGIGKAGEGVQLFEGFKTFVPEKHRPLHNQILNDLKQRSSALNRSTVIDLVKDENQSISNMAMKRKLHPDFVGKRPIEYEPLYSETSSNGNVKRNGSNIGNIGNIDSIESVGSVGNFMPSIKSNTFNALPTPSATTTPSTTTTLPTLSTPNVCPICRDPIVDGHHAKCGHEACYGCWTEWLSRTLECPLCRQRTRIPQLRK